MLRKLRFSLLTLLMVMLISSCAPQHPIPEVKMFTDPLKLPPADSYGIPLYGSFDSQKGIVCLITVDARYLDHTLWQRWYLVPFVSGPVYTWTERYDQTVKSIRDELIGAVNHGVAEAFGISQSLWFSNSADPADPAAFHFFLETANSVTETVIQQDMFYDQYCPQDWTISYTITTNPTSQEQQQDQWQFWVSRPNDGPTVYLNVKSTRGSVEIPVSRDQMVAVISGSYDVSTAFESIEFEDATISTGPQEYLSREVDNAMSIKSTGELVTQVQWSNIESKDLVLDFTSRALLLSAWSSGKEIHQPAMTAFMFEKISGQTDISVGFRSSFFLFGGSTSSVTSIRQSFTTMPTFQGDIYLLNR